MPARVDVAIGLSFVGWLLIVSTSRGRAECHLEREKVIRATWGTECLPLWMIEIQTLLRVCCATCQNTCFTFLQRSQGWDCAPYWKCPRLTVRSSDRPVRRRLHNEYALLRRLTKKGAGFTSTRLIAFLLYKDERRRLLAAALQSRLRFMQSDRPHEPGSAWTLPRPPR